MTVSPSGRLIEHVPVAWLVPGDKFVDEDPELQLDDYDLDILEEDAATVVEVDRRYADLVRVKSYDVDPDAAAWSQYGDPDQLVVRLKAPASDME